MVFKISLIFSILVIFQLCGCASKELTNARQFVAQTDVSKNRLSPAENGTDAANIKRLVIFDAEIVIEASKTDTIHKILIDIAKKYNGYVLLSSNIKSSIRIPAHNLDNAIEDIDKLGRIIHKNVKGSDITNEYNDLEIRLDNAEQARQRYLELLKKAENVEAALKVEKELERLNGEIDLLKGKLNRLAHLSEFSTISVTTKRKTTPGPLGYFFVGVYKFVEKLFIWSY